LTMRSLLIMLVFVQHYLLMGPIQDSFVTGDYSRLGAVCADTVSINMEDPVDLRGNYGRDRFISILSGRMKGFRVFPLEWISKHIWEDYAVQSFNITLRNRLNERDYFYKLIFFMNREGKEWKVYYLRGIKL